MEEKNEYQELDLLKIWKVINYRKYYSLAIYVILIISAIIITAQIPKQYTSEASILINQSSSTNLADINPYILDKVLSTSSKSLGSFLSGGADDLKNNIEIIKSPLVMDKVIKENNITYKSGPKARKFLSTKDFIEKKNLIITDKKDTNIIEISYESDDPEVSYNIVKSIIDTYQEVSEAINSRRASKDRAFLEDELAKTEQEMTVVQKKIKQFKQANNILGPEIDLQLLTSSGGMNPYKKSIANKISNFPEIEIRFKELEVQSETIMDKYKLLKEKYEWAFLVERMSRNATNISILQQPEIKESFEKSSPSLKRNIIISVVLAIILSSVFVIMLEMIDKKLSYLHLNTDSLFWLNKQTDQTKLNNLFLNLKKKMDDISATTIHVIQLNLSETDQQYFMQQFKSFLTRCNDVKTLNYIDLTDVNTVYNFIDEANAVLLVAKIGQTDRQTYEQIERILEDQKKLIQIIIITFT
jgi:uncharacterized protein involved in exopolysaccharide biosynthesis